MAKFIAKYPNVRTDWLFTGKGDMLREQDIQLATPVINNTFPLRTDMNMELQAVPLYDFDAAAGLVSLFNQGGQIIGQLQIPNTPRVDGAIYITGDSMFPLLKSGDIILYKEIKNMSSGIMYGEMYLVSFVMDDDDYVVVKYIQKSDSNGMIKLVSHNEFYAPREIPLSSIRALAIIKASVKYNMLG